MALIQFEDLPSTNTPLNAANLNNNFQGLYPVGGTFISETNTNPSTTLGFGTWTLIDKVFTPEYKSSATGFWTDSANAECTSYYHVRNGHTIQIGITLTTKTAIADSPISLGTFDFGALGILGTIFTRRPIGYSDDGDVIVGATLNYSSGALSTIDIFPHGTLASGNSITFNIDIITARANMTDAKCNQFIWRRTA